MTHHSLAHEFLTIENAPPGGGVPIVTLPTAPVAPSPGATLPTPPLPSPPSPVLPTPGIETADAFEFAEMVVGNPGSPEEAFALLGLQSGPTSGSGGISYGGETTTFFLDEGAVFFHDFPGPLGGSGGTLAREDFLEQFERCLFIADGDIDLCLN